MMNILEEVELRLCKVVFMFMGHEWRLRLMNARVRFAEAVI